VLVARPPRRRKLDRASPAPSRVSRRRGSRSRAAKGSSTHSQPSRVTATAVPPPVPESSPASPADRAERERGQRCGEARSNIKRGRAGTIARGPAAVPRRRSARSKRRRCTRSMGSGAVAEAMACATSVGRCRRGDGLCRGGRPYRARVVTSTNRPPNARGVGVGGCAAATSALGPGRRRWRSRWRRRASSRLSWARSVACASGE
jgi:hypothetical protein